MKIGEKFITRTDQKHMRFKYFMSCWIIIYITSKTSPSLYSKNGKSNINVTLNNGLVFQTIWKINLRNWWIVHNNVCLRSCYYLDLNKWRKKKPMTRDLLKYSIELRQYKFACHIHEQIGSEDVKENWRIKFWISNFYFSIWGKQPPPILFNKFIFWHRNKSRTNVFDYNMMSFRTIK